ncbi:MAG TPA: hypothetical protein VK447_15355 [Myxococcaceae bacterium]|nr:hypothetical protein [Myxococcaceae bacterium]
MLRTLTQFYWTLLAVFFPALAFAQQHETTRPSTAPALPGLLMLGLVFLAGVALIFFRRYTNDRHRRGQG